MSLRETLLHLEAVRKSYQVRRASLEDIKRARLEAQAKIKALNKKRNIGKKMSTVGLALIISPDPFTDIVGVPLFILGRYIDRTYSSLTISDVVKEARSAMEALRDGM